MIGLPGEVDTDKVEAKLENGILTIVISKTEIAKPKQITVKSGNPTICDCFDDFKHELHIR